MEQQIVASALLQRWKYMHYWQKTMAHMLSSAEYVNVEVVRPPLPYGIPMMRSLLCRI